jgi:hypothetical protein
MNLFGFQLIEITPVGLLCLVGWIVAGVALGKLLYKDDRQLIALKREANELAETLGRWGFSIIPKLLTDFVVSDPVSLVNDFRAAADRFKNPKEVRVLLEKLLSNMIKEELKDTTTRQAFLDGVVAEFAAQGVHPSTSAAAGTTSGKAPANGAASTSSSAQPAHVTNVTVHAPTGTTTTADAAPVATAAAPAKAA